MKRREPISCNGPLYEPTAYPDVKDPSPVRVGDRWHLFGTGCGRPHGLEILHATAPELDGPWREEPPVQLLDADMITSAAAPGVIAEGERLHMFLQHDFDALDGAIEHLVSDDGGVTFVRHDTALRSVPGGPEAGVYDPDPAEIDGERYLTYAAMSVVGEPELFLARSTSGSWDGPWERLGCILDHTEVDCHNQLGDPDYEWGLEGPHLLQLPSGRSLLSAVCFLPGNTRGQRQRLLLAIADDPEGPYDVLGPLVAPSGVPATGENGHGTAVLDDGEVTLVYQERQGEGRPWKFMSARFDELALPARTRSARGREAA